MHGRGYRHIFVPLSCLKMVGAVGWGKKKRGETQSSLLCNVAIHGAIDDRGKSAPVFFHCTIHMCFTRRCMTPPSDAIKIPAQGQQQQQEQLDLSMLLKNKSKTTKTTISFFFFYCRLSVSHRRYWVYWITAYSALFSRSLMLFKKKGNRIKGRKN